MKYIMVNQSTRWNHVSMKHHHKCNGILKRQMEPMVCIMENVFMIIHQKGFKISILIKVV